ncbi:MAG: hypothetical protein JSU08_08555 [Acidobacteria bacterium]|nr:hypothetical protein [Acidobacteriota bacterium]
MNANAIPHRPTANIPAAAAPRSAVVSWMTSGLFWSAVVSVACVGWVLFAQDGREYYLTPLSTRAYSTAHPLLRPSGPIGQTLGVVGAALMLVPFVYMLRKRIPGLRAIGSARGWLEVHLFCGVVGPVLVTLHTSFKFNGIISAAYWSMVIVMLSGFVGRFLFVRIPRSIRGSELTRSELDARAESLNGEIAESVQSMALLERVHAFEASVVPSGAHLSFLDLFTGELTLGRKAHRFEQELTSAGLSPELAHAVVTLTRERATLLRRIAYLQKTKTLFGLWHVFHLPLVYLMLVIVAAHIGVALYLGYVPFRW